jgi:cytochrome P450 / NADPH-cytochrome P450 reductase
MDITMLCLLKLWLNTDRLLMPAFGTVALRGMFDDMMDVCSQLLLKWER